MTDIGKNTKLEMDKQFSIELGKALSSGTENVSDFLQTSQSFKNSITTENTDDDNMIKKKLKKKDIINNITKKIDKPFGKLYSIGGENKEATGAVNAGGFVPLLSGEVKEKWSQKYKDSINCDNPKGFSQKAHCKGKEKSEKSEFKEGTSSASSGSYATPAAWAKSTSKKDWRGKSKTQIPGGQFVQVKKKCKKFPYCNQGDIKALKFTNEEIIRNTITKISKKYNVSEQFIKKLMIRDYLKIK